MPNPNPNPNLLPSPNLLPNPNTKGILHSGTELMAAMYNFNPLASAKFMGQELGWYPHPDLPAPEHPFAHTLTLILTLTLTLIRSVPSS